MEENGLSTKWNLQQTRLLCWGKWSSHRQHCWLKRWTHLLSWILQCFSLFILLKQTCLKDTMKVLWKSDWTHVNCALEHQWCKYTYLYFENLTVPAYHASRKLTFLLFRAVPWCRVVSSTCVASHSESSAEAGPRAESQGSLEQNFLRSPPTQVGDRNSLWQHKSLSMVEKTFAYPLYSTQCLVMTNVIELNQ